MEGPRGGCFFGRETELGKLSTFYGSRGQSVALIYGCRRVRKSELIKQALGDLGMKRVYYENEVVMHLRSEIRKIANANEVFEALASGHTRFGDILGQSHVPSSPALADVYRG